MRRRATNQFRDLSIRAAWLLIAFAWLTAAGAWQPGLADQIAALRSAVRERPDDAALQYRLGLLLGRAGEFTSAGEAFRIVLKLRPADADAHFNLGLTLVGNPMDKMDWPGAIGEFRAALHARPDFAEARRMLAEGLLNTGDAAGAIRELEMLLKARPDYPEARFSLALALDEVSRTQEAIEQARRVTQARPEWAEPHATLAKLLARGGKNDLARAAAERCLRLNPDLPDAHLTLARVLQARNDPQAQVALRQAQRLARRKSDANRAVRLSNQGLDAAAKGDLEGAVAWLRRAAETKPDYAIARHNLGLLLADSGDLRGAAAELRLAASLGPALAKPWFSLGRLLEKCGDPAAALGAFERAAHLDPSGGAAAARARELRAAGIRPVAPAVVPDTPEGHNQAGIERAQAGDLLGAAAEFLRALTLKPDFADARYNLGMAMSRRNDREGAELELRKTLAVHADARTHFALGLALKSTDLSGAAREFEQALALDPAHGGARREIEALHGRKP